MLRQVRIFSALILLLSVSGCGTLVDTFFMPPPEDTAQELFEAGNDAMREKNYAAAINYYTRLKDNFQFSPYTVETELSLADAQFLDENWEAAIDAYQEFESMHPRHEAIPYVLFNIGVAYVKLYPSIDRPITPVDQAYSYFKRVRESYPASEDAEKAEENMKVARHLMAEHELYIADFYYRAGNYGPAWSRYKGLIDNYKDVPDIYAHAEEKGQTAFILYKLQTAQKVRETREGSWKQWFSWL